MKDILIGDDGDMIFSHSQGDLAMVSDEDEIYQKIRIALGTNEMELEWNPDFGLSHGNVMDNIYDTSYVQTIIDDYLTTTFEEVNDVRITKVIQKENRQLYIELTVELSNGTKLTMSTDLGGEDDAAI